MASHTICLGQIALARSGDKGNHSNIGVIAFTQAGYEYLVEHLTAEVVWSFFASTGTTGVERYELENIRGLNFVLYNSLGGGASLSLRTDTQGKLLGTAILQLEIPAPRNPRSMVPESNP